MDLFADFLCTYSSAHSLRFACHLSPQRRAQADTACRFSICCIKALGLRNSDPQVDNVSERSIRVLRIGGRHLHDVEEIPILIDQRLTVAIKVRRGNAEFIGSSDFGRKRVGEVFICTHHGVAILRDPPCCRSTP